MFAQQNRPNPDPNEVFLGGKITAIEFFKLCKSCKVYPVVIAFDDLKKIVLKHKDVWSFNQNGNSEQAIQSQN